MAKIIGNYRDELISKKEKKVAAIVLGRWFSGKSSYGSSMKNCVQIPNIRAKSRHGQLSGESHGAAGCQ